MSLLLQSLVIFAVVCASLLVNSNSHRNGDSGYKNEPCDHDPDSFEPPDESSTSRERRYEAGRCGRNSAMGFWARRAPQHLAQKCS
jgi:hypothetical protein